MKWLVDYLDRELNLQHDQRETIEYGLASLLYTALSVVSALLLVSFWGSTGNSGNYFCNHALSQSQRWRRIFPHLTAV